MIRLGGWVAAVAVVAAGCGVATPQTATVDTARCTVAPTSLGVGDVAFTVNNSVDWSVLFTIAEDGGATEVARANVPAGDVAHLKVHFDPGDEYIIRCGDTLGPTIKP